MHNAKVEEKSDIFICFIITFIKWLFIQYPTNIQIFIVYLQNIKIIRLLPLLSVTV